MRLEARARSRRARCAGRRAARGASPSRCSSRALLVAWAGAPVGRTYALLLRGRLRLALRVERDADARDAADPHRTRRRGRLPRAPLQHRRRRPALRRRARRGRGRRHARRHRLRRCRRWLLFPLMMAAAALAGALLLLGPALLKNALGVDEVVTTLLLNFIVLLFVSMLLDGPMKDPTAMGWPQSVALPDELRARQARSSARACTPACCGRVALARAALWALLQVHDVRLRDARGRRQCARRAFAGVPVHAHGGAGGAAVGRAGRPRRRDRGRRAAPAT